MRSASWELVFCGWLPVGRRRKGVLISTRGSVRTVLWRASLSALPPYPASCSQTDTAHALQMGRSRPPEM